MNYKDKKIGIVGFGSVGKQLYNALLESNYTEDQIYIFADDIETVRKNRNFKFNDFKLDEFRDLHFIPALGYLSKNLKYKILEYLTNNGYEIFSFVHPTAFVSKTATIGKGVFIYPMCNIDQGAVIEDGCVILNSSVISHDTFVGKCSYLGPSVTLSGLVRIDELCFIGTASMVSNNLSVGRNSTVAIGTCLTKSIGEDSFVIGNPFQHKKNLTII